MNLAQNPFEPPVGDSRATARGKVEFRRNQAIVSLVSVLIPFAILFCIQITSGVISGGQFFVLFGTSVVGTLVLGSQVHKSWKIKLAWVLALLMAYIVVFVAFFLVAVLFGGLEGT